MVGFSEMLPLRTPRLLLRRFAEADAGPFAAYRNDPDVARYQGWETPYGLDQAAELVRQQATCDPGVTGEWLQIAIEHAATGALVGDCAFKLSADQRQATIGATLARAYQGEGYAAEAITRLLDYLFQTVGLHRVVADTDARNTPAWTLLERLGFRREGHVVQGVWFKGSGADEYQYAILRDEWLNVGRAESRRPPR